MPLDPAAPRIAVVGAGVAGLAAAHRIRAGQPAADVVVLEATDRVGGKLKTAEVGGVVVDVGAEAMLARRPEAIDLLEEIGLAADLVHPATTAANLWNRGRLQPMPRTVMGVPVDLRGLDGLISPKGRARAALDAVLPPTRLEGHDVSVGFLVEERLGKEVVDRLVEPLLGGVYAGHARELSARAAVPQLLALLDGDRSMVRAAAAAAPRPDADRPAAPVFAGLRGGVGRLAEALVSASAASVRTGATVRDLAARPGGGWNVLVGDTRRPEVLQVDGVVLATPAPPTARLLSDVAPRAALELARVEYASVAIVTMAFRARDVPEVAGSGFLVPPVDRRAVKAATFSFAKWDWVRTAGAEIDGGVLVLRCSLGRHRDAQALQHTDAELTDLVLDDLSAAIGLSVRPVDTHVQRWGGGLPQYAVGHLDRVAAVRADVARVSGLEICGAAYDGLGIPACIASADLAATRLLDDLRRRATMEP